MSSYRNSGSSDRGSGGSRGGYRGGQSSSNNYSRGGSGGRRPRPIKEIDVHALVRNIENAKNLPQPEPHVTLHQFEDFDILPELKLSIAKRGYITPTPIQDLAIPPILNGEDVVAIANTGTGKSGAFLIPLIDKILEDNTQRVLVIVPTRELAMQLDDELRKLTVGMRIYSVIGVGGLSIMPQRAKLRQPHNVVIGTPGRLTDLVDRGDLKLERYATIVLDEVDRMLDMGFVADMQYLINQMAPVRQSLFFSATITPAVERIMKDFVQEYTKVSAKTPNSPVNIEQIIIELSRSDDKVQKLKEVLDEFEVKKALVFVRTKWSAQRLGDQLYQDGYQADSIHGDKRQSQRQKIMQNFKSGSIAVLVATDVAARGLDINELSHVINFDLPETNDDYTHRIGRVGRAGKKGAAISFVVR